MNKEIRRIKSNIPVYVVGVIWILYALIFPMYSIAHYITVAVLSVVGYVAASALVPGRTIEIEVVEELKEVKTGISEADEILVEGRAYILRLSQLAIDIKSEKIKPQIRELDEISRKIYDFLSKHPEKALSVRTFTNYYLPTTISLLDSYSELEKQDEFKGQNIIEMTTKIEEAVSGFSTAYKKLLDDLYKDKSMDLQADISVLQTMMSRQGLVLDKNQIGYMPSAQDVVKEKLSTEAGPTLVKSDLPDVVSLERDTQKAVEEMKEQNVNGTEDSGGKEASAGGNGQIKLTL